MKRNLLCILLILALSVVFTLPVFAEDTVTHYYRFDDNPAQLEITNVSSVETYIEETPDLPLVGHYYYTTYFISAPTTVTYLSDYYGGLMSFSEEEWNPVTPTIGDLYNDYVLPGTVYQLSEGMYRTSTTMDFSIIYLVVGSTDPSTPSPSPPTPAYPLDGAADWARAELEHALAAKLLVEDMYGNWTQQTSRLLAADAIVRLIEVSTDRTIDEIAAEKGFNMNDKFADTDSKAATFMKASGISNGLDGVNYGSTGTFTRAQLVTMLGRMAENVFDIDLSGYPIGSATFNDIPDNMSWAEQYIGWAVSIGITQGDGGSTTFNPGGNLTNQQTGLFTYRAFDMVFSG